MGAPGAAVMPPKLNEMDADGDNAPKVPNKGMMDAVKDIRQEAQAVMPPRPPQPVANPAAKVNPPAPPAPMPPRPAQPAYQAAPEVKKERGSFMDLVRSLSSLKATNMNTGEVMAGAVFVLATSALWLLCVWSWCLTLKIWFNIPVSHADIFTYIREQFFWFLFGIISYIFITRVEMEFYWANTVKKHKGWFFVALCAFWMVMAGIDYSGVYTIVNGFFSNHIHFAVFTVDINLAVGAWYTIILMHVTTILMTFFTEIIMIKSWRVLLESAGVVFKTNANNGNNNYNKR
jgi:hypothetical protein